MKKGQQVEATKWPIPNDWNEEQDGYLCYLMCVPNSRQWVSIFDGQISDLAYGRNYNKLSGSIKDAQEVARGIFESMCAMKCDDLIATLNLIAVNISDLTATIKEQGDIKGQVSDPPASDGEVLFGPEYQFPVESAYLSAKCNAANAIYDTILGTITWLKVNNADLFLGTFGGITTGLILALTLAGPAGWAIIVLDGVIAGLSAFLIANLFNFGDMETALTSIHSELVNALYDGINTENARAGFMDALDDGPISLTTAERELFEFLLPNNVLNQLFEPNEDLAAYVSSDPITCLGGCTDWLLVGTTGDGRLYASEWDQASNGYFVTLTFNWDQVAELACGSPQSITVSLVSGALVPVAGADPCPGPGAQCIYRLRSVPTANDDIYVGNDPPTWPICTRTIIVSSQTPFSVTIDREDCVLP